MVTSPTSAPVKRRGRKSEKLTGDDLTLGLWVIFGLIASLRGEHWRKTPEELEPLGGPLAEWIASMPSARSKAISKWMFPISIVLAAGAVLADPIKVEVELAKAKKQRKDDNVKQPSGISQTSQGNQGYYGQPEPEYNLGVPSPTTGSSETIELAQHFNRPESINNGSIDSLG